MRIPLILSRAGSLVLFPGSAILPLCTKSATVGLALTASSDLPSILTGVFWPIAAQAVRHPVARGVYPQHIVGFALDPQ